MKTLQINDEHIEEFLALLKVGKLRASHREKLSPALKQQLEQWIWEQEQ